MYLFLCPFFLLHPQVIGYGGNFLGLSVFTFVVAPLLFMLGRQDASRAAAAAKEAAVLAEEGGGGGGVGGGRVGGGGGGGDDSDLEAAADAGRGRWAAAADRRAPLSCSGACLPAPAPVGYSLGSGYPGGATGVCIVYCPVH